MKRRIIKINKEKCNGCGLCVTACHEGAMELFEGKARLMRDDYCDGLGDCLPVCPMNAISFEEREAAAYDEAAVKVNIEKRKAVAHPLPCGCPGSNAKHIERAAEESAPNATEQKSRLSQWPVQIKLVPPSAPYFDGANLLIAADCTAYAYGAFHEKFVKNHVTLIGCPKLDATDYAVKLTEIIKNNNIKSVKIVRMEVPCCGGMENAAKEAIQKSGKIIPWQVYTVSTDGQIID